MNRDEILLAIEAMLDGETPTFHKEDKIIMVRNPWYDPEIEGSFPALAIKLDELKKILREAYVRRAE